MNWDVTKLVLDSVMQTIKNKKKNPSDLKPNMTRKERRAWFHLNRKDLKLPRWSELHKLKSKE